MAKDPSAKGMDRNITKIRLRLRLRLRLRMRPSSRFEVRGWR
jgi:hypothetical protein